MDALLFLKTVNKSLSVFITVVVILATLGLIYLLYKVVLKEIRRYKEEVANYIDGVETKREIIADVNAYISRSVSAEFTLLNIDIDKFTNVIENFGDVEAERIIKGIANKLLETIPARVMLGRIKTDQFVVFARGDYSREEMVRLAKKILTVVSSPIKVYDESSLQLTCSIGICYYPSHGRNFKELFESLQIATFICKRSGGNQYRIYTREESKDEGANMEYYYQIKNGIKNKEFDIFYQPMIDCNTKDIYAFEGLLRWNHPELGILSPHKFINIMEQTGDINWVGLWGLETVIKEHLELRRKYNKEYYMSINLSPKQLANPTLPQDFQKLIKKYRVSAKHFVLEIEEFTIFEKLDQVKNNLTQLSEIGFQIAVDGFGLDYKALKKLEENSVDVIKLDREFLNNDDDQYLKEKFVGILVDFVKNQEHTLVCEGVENYDYLERAENMGLNIFQGYYFAKPMSGEDVFEYVNSKDWLYKLEKPAEMETFTQETVRKAEELNEMLDSMGNEKPVEETPVEKEEQTEEVIEEDPKDKKAKKDKKQKAEDTIVEETPETEEDKPLEEQLEVQEEAPLEEEKVSNNSEEVEESTEETENSEEK